MVLYQGIVCMLMLRCSHLNAYMDMNLTTWDAAGYTVPKNAIVDGC